MKMASVFQDRALYVAMSLNTFVFATTINSKRVTTMSRKKVQKNWHLKEVARKTYTLCIIFKTIDFERNSDVFVFKMYGSIVFFK